MLPCPLQRLGWKLVLKNEKTRRKQNKDAQEKRKKKETKESPLVTQSSEGITSTAAVCSTSAGRPAAQLRVKGTAYCGVMVATWGWRVATISGVQLPWNADEAGEWNTRGGRLSGFRRLRTPPSLLPTIRSPFLSPQMRCQTQIAPPTVHSRGPLGQVSMA